MIKYLITYIENGSTWIGAVWGNYQTKEDALNRWLQGIKNPESIKILKVEEVEY